MRATLLISTKRVFADGSIAQVVVWRVPRPVSPGTHALKYRLFYGQAGQRLVGFDNERGKGDHKHVLGKESTYTFTTLEQLLRDFAAEVERVSGRQL